jgi:cytochrome P450
MRSEIVNESAPQQKQNGFTYDPFSLEAMTHPKRFYPTLREEYPAYYMADYDAFAISRYADVWDGFLDSKNFSEAEGQIYSRDLLREHHRGNPPAPRLDPLDIFNHLDGALHTRFRQVMAPSLLKPSVNRMEPDITALVQDRLKLLLAQGEFDLNHDFASYVSAGATCLVLGIPLTEVPNVIRLVNAGMAREPNQPGFTEQGMAAIGELFGLVMSIVAGRRAGNSEGNVLIDALLTAEFMERQLTDFEIAQNLVSILVGGSESVPKVFAGGLLELWKRPEQLAEAAKEPANAVPTFEEMLRFSAPAQWFGRTVKNGRDLAGVTLEPGQRVLLLIAAANRDPREFENPDEFIWNRKAKRMLSFGIGPHFCIGIHLARLEGQIMLREFLAAVPKFEIDEAGGNWAVSEFQIGWTRLGVRITG